MPQFEMCNPSTELTDSIRDVDCEYRSSDAQHFRQWKRIFAYPIVNIQWHPASDPPTERISHRTLISLIHQPHQSASSISLWLSPSNRFLLASLKSMQISQVIFAHDWQNQRMSWDCRGSIFETSRQLDIQRLDRSRRFTDYCESHEHLAFLSVFLTFHDRIRWNRK
jgi:hypothetical protein